MYSIRKSRHIMRASYDWYKKRSKTLSPERLSAFEFDLEHLDQTLLKEDRAEADAYAHKLEEFCSKNFKKSFWEYAWELAVALVFALLIASVVRTMWFEPYEIPTGSMRPTFEEQDHLTVSKLAFGINVPFQTKHFYFDPDLVQRTSVFIFTGEHLPYIDQKTTFFGVIPYTKRYIKRCMGRPGDTLYFYGGKIYGIDKDGNPINEFLNSPYMQHLEHLPFRVFEGEISIPTVRKAIINQMHLPVGRINFSTTGAPRGEVFNGVEWVKDLPLAMNSPHNKIETYSDLWGIRNYAMTRLLTKEQIKRDTTIDAKELPDGVLYLELRHTPSLSYSNPESSGQSIVTPYRTLLPLQQNHLDAIMNNMYTARFVVQNGQGKRYSVDDMKINSSSPRFPGVPDGTYEFYFGKGVRVGWGGITYALEKDHPLYKHDSANIQKLYNLGIEMDLAVAPQVPQRYYPSRYAYFRDGDLYLLGAPILKKEDPALMAFNEREKQKEKNATPEKPYVSFKDFGPPLKEDGSFDSEFIQTFGIKIPEKQYLALGDNHAMSSDSRVFGFIPEDNLQGVPSLIIWPPGERWGFPMQKPYPVFVAPRMIVWGIVLAILAIWYGIHRYRIKRPIYKKITRLET